METKSEQTPTVAPDKMPPRRKKGRWLDWALLLFGALCITLFVLQVVRYSRAKKLKEAGPTGEVIAGLNDVDRLPAQSGDAAGKNVLLITMDTTRADHLGCYGNRGIRTPNIDGLAKSGVLCASAFTPSPSTLPGHSSILTGLYPYHHGARSNGTFKLGDEQVTLAEMLKENGYATGAVISSYVLDGRFGTSQGFDDFNDDLTKGVKYSAHTFRERPAEYTNEVAFQWITDHKDSKFFYWIHYFDAHAPYVPPEPYRSQYRKYGGYDGEIAYVDSKIGDLLAKLEELGLRDKTLIVLAGDHGEGLGEHGEQTHAMLTYDATLHTPLLFSLPGLLPKDSVIRSQVCNVEITPTILDLLGITVDRKFDGVSLLRPAAQRPKSMYLENIATLVLHGWAPLFGIRTLEGKYIHAPHPEFYDLTNDPKELTNLFDQRTEDVARYKKILDTHLGTDSEYGKEVLGQAVTMDRETEEKLGALGYISTTKTEDLTLEEAYQFDPKDMVHHWEKIQAGTNLISAGQIEEGTKLLEETVEEVPNSIWALRCLASAYSEQGRDDEAIELTKRALEVEKHDPGLYVSYGRLLASKGDFDEAREVFDEADKLEPNYAPTIVARAAMAVAQRDFDKAEQLYRRAIEIDPGTTGPMAYNEMGHMFLSLLEYDKAREAFESALKIDNLNGAARAGLGSLLVAEGKEEEAKEEFKQALRYAPGEPNVHAFLAGLYQKEGDMEKARKNAEMALKINKKHVAAMNNLGLVLKSTADIEEAIATFQKALEIQPYYLPCRINLAQCYLAENEDEKAAAEWSRVLEYNPRSPIPLCNLGVYYANRGQYAKAQQYFVKALRSDPDYALAHQHLGNLLLQQGKPAQALEHLKKSLELDPDQPTREELETNIHKLEEAVESD